jgi:tetratricopeptide (TPR) repeat protein
MAKQTTENPAETTPTAAPKGDAATVLASYQRYRWLPIAGLVAVVLIAGGLFLYNNYQREQQNEAADQIVFAMDAFVKDSFQLALVGDGQYPGFETLVEDYGSTETGNLCRYYLGASYLRLGQFEKGIAALEDYKKGDNMLAAMAYHGIGYGYEQLKQFDKAATAFVSASEVKANEETTPLFLFQAGRSFELATRQDKALQIYQRIATEYPLSPEAEQVKADIARLSVK